MAGVRIAAIEEAVAEGFTGQWSGAAPSWHSLLLGRPVSDLLEQYFTYSAYTALWGSNDSQGMRDLMEAMALYRPEAPLDDYCMIGWMQGLITMQILEKAIDSGDLTRGGVLAAANTVTADLKGLAPDQTWNGEPDDCIVRESYFYDIDKSSCQPGATASGGHTNTGYELLDGPYLSQVAKNWEYQPCSDPSLHSHPGGYDPPPACNTLSVGHAMRPAERLPRCSLPACSSHSPLFSAPRAPWSRGVPGGRLSPLISLLIRSDGFVGQILRRCSRRGNPSPWLLASWPLMFPVAVNSFISFIVCP